MAEEGGGEEQKYDVLQKIGISPLTSHPFTLHFTH